MNSDQFLFLFILNINYLKSRSYTYLITLTFLSLSKKYYEFLNSLNFNKSKKHNCKNYV